MGCLVISILKDGFDHAAITFTGSNAVGMGIAEHAASPNDTPIVQEEIFGPLLVVQQAQSIDDALSLANSTPFGLSVSLFTRDINAALRYIQDIECGMVRVNGDTTGVDPHAPFGGMRASSSHSREQGTAAIEFFTEMKTVQINPAG